MENLNPIKAELPPMLLDAMETYVRAYETYQQQPNDVPSDEHQAAVEKCRKSAESVANWLKVVLADAEVPGTLGEALAEAKRNREARYVSRASSLNTDIN